MVKHIGILALQGDFQAHQEKLHELGAKSLLIREPYQLNAVEGLIIPGGESTTMLKLLSLELREELTKRIQVGLPVFATCAGCILLAKHVIEPEQESFGLIDIDVRRNAYGRQVNSFITSNLKWTDRGLQATQHLNSVNNATELEGVFIRAPQITRTGSEVDVLIEHKNESNIPSPVLVRQKNIFAATFHPELSSNCKIFYQLAFDVRL
jgi:pyridoxal 5'-phosphate synthase pdxT subunit